MNEVPPRAEKVQPLAGRHVRVEFTDGTIATMDLNPLLQGPVFAAVVAFDRAFAQVRISAEWGCLEWPGGIDIAPDALYERALGERASSAN
jgi:hypothetical protein